MNDQEFALLIEKYLDHALAPAEREALQSMVQEDGARRAQFETQVRQHVRLHAETGRCDLSESQQVARMVVDVVRRERRVTLMDVLHETTLRQRVRMILGGLRSPRGSPARRQAAFELERIASSAASVVLVSAAFLLLVCFWRGPEIVGPPQRGDGFSVTFPPPEDASPVVPAPKPDVAPEGEIDTPGDWRRGLAGIVEPGPPAAPAGDIASEAPGGNETAVAPMQPASPASPGPRVLPGFAFAAIPEMSGRTAKGRAEQLKKHNRQAADAMEKAVAKSLDWLKAQQQPDGAWPGQEPAAMTGLALLCFLAHGETHISPFYGPTVESALRYLMRVQDEQGRFSANAYAHGIAVYAMAEATAMTRIMEVQAAMEKGLQVLLNGQQTHGGFDYNYAKGARFDTSVSGWQFQAFHAARTAGVKDPRLDEAIRRSLDFLKTQSFAADGSGFVYSGTPGQQPAQGATWTMTGVGTLCLQLLDEARSPESRAGLRALENTGFAWPKDARQKVPVYGGYYLAQARFYQGGPGWDAWNRQLVRELMGNQISDGHWENGDHETGPNVYTTALCTLMLEVYYRYLPSSQRAAETTARAASTASNDVAVSVE